MAVGATSQKPPMAARLRGVVISLRADLHVSRHVYRGEPCYVIHDPVTFQSHRFSIDEYRAAVAIDQAKTLGDAFKDRCDAGDLSPEDEETFYEFVLSLHKSGLLSLPISDDQMLYDRYVRKQRARASARLKGMLFLRVPLCNPDAFLVRTLRYAQWLFTRWAFAGWALLMVLALTAAIGRRGDLMSAAAGSLDLANLPILWILLIGLKLVHEFGHAYACARFGGRVPEMGVFLIVFTPTAYVDASAAWSFPRMRQRMIVNLGGMYFESIIAAIAIIVWAMTAPSLLNHVAFQAALLASVTTILFNINPLARFDGYYMLSDALAIPNLRARATAELYGAFNRITLGLRSDASGFTLPLRLLLMTYAVGSACYRVLIVLGISAIVALKFFYVGFGIAALYVGGTIVGVFGKLAKHFFVSEETAPVRRRAVAVGILMLAGLPSAFLFVPVPIVATASGAVVSEGLSIVRAPAEGILTLHDIPAGERVRAGDVIARIEDVGRTGDLEIAMADIEVAAAQMRLARDLDPAEQRRAAHVYEAALRRAAETADHQANRNVPVPITGVLLPPPAGQALHGSFVREGDPIARISSGTWTIEVLIDPAKLSGDLPRENDLLACRSSTRPERVFMARVRRVAPAASRRIDAEALSSSAGGQILVDSGNGEALTSHVRVTLTVEDPLVTVHEGETVTVAVHEDPVTAAARVRRRFLTFVDGVRAQ